MFINWFLFIQDPHIWESQFDSARTQRSDARLVLLVLNSRFWTAYNASIIVYCKSCGCLIMNCHAQVALLRVLIGQDVQCGSWGTCPRMKLVEGTCIYACTLLNSFYSRCARRRDRSGGARSRGKGPTGSWQTILQYESINENKE